MSLEQAIEKLTAAIEANTAAVTAAAGSAPAAAPAATGKGKKADTPKADTPKVTREQMTKALNDVKEAKGVDAAKGIIKDVGKAAKMADIADNLIEAVYNAAVEKLAEEEGM